MVFRASSTVIETLEMLLEVRKAKKHSPGGLYIFTLFESRATFHMFGSQYPAQIHLYSFNTMLGHVHYYIIQYIRWTDGVHG